MLLKWLATNVLHILLVVNNYGHAQADGSLAAGDGGDMMMMSVGTAISGPMPDPALASSVLLAPTSAESLAPVVVRPDSTSSTLLPLALTSTLVNHQLDSNPSSMIGDDSINGFAANNGGGSTLPVQEVPIAANDRSKRPVEFRSFSIAKASVMNRIAGGTGQNVQHGSEFGEASSHRSEETTPEPLRHGSTLTIAAPTSFISRQISSSAQLLMTNSEADLIEAPKSVTPITADTFAHGSTASQAHNDVVLIDDDFDQTSDENEDYGTNLDKVKPDDVDNEVIEELVNRFLNSGTLENEQNDKQNKNAQKLVNSSVYWSANDLQPEGSITNETEAQEWIDGYSVEAQKILHRIAIDGWNYVTSVSQLTKQLLDESEQVLADFVKVSSKQARQFNMTNSEDPSLKRQFEILAAEGMSALNHADYEEFMESQKVIAKTYAETSICDAEIKTICAYRVTDIKSKLLHENNATAALHYWISWRRALGSKLITSYTQLTQFINKGAILNGFDNGGSMWKSPYELSTRYNKPQLDIVAELERLYRQIAPFYKQLHSYMRRKMAALYGPSELGRDSAIPAHLLRNIAGENWIGLYSLTKPFNDDDDLSEIVRISLQKRNYTAKSMFKQAYKYYKHLGLGKLPKSLWLNSVFTRTWSKDMLCHPQTVYDMRNGTDFRVKVCAQVTDQDFKLAHKLLIQAYYYQLCSEQPFLFRDATNPSFLTALSNAFEINAGNIGYLKAIKLLPIDASLSQSTSINHLYSEALDQFVQLPFDIVADLWRIHIFENQTTSETWNEDWWKLRHLYQGIKPPIERHSTDFDAIAASTIAQTNSPAMRHFISYVMQFQILKVLCSNTTHLSNGCVMKNSSVEILKRVMSLGSSVTWLKALEIVTGAEKLDAQPLIEYYQPLITWLEEKNQNDGAAVGWDGPGTPFAESEIDVRNSLESKVEHQSNSAVGNQYAFPGGDCSNGKECLLDSVCQNGICECSPGLFTLKIANTHNCVPDDPANAGFGDGQGGLVIGLHATNNTTLAPNAIPEPVAEPSPAFDADSDDEERKLLKTGLKQNSVPSHSPHLCVLLFALLFEIML